MATISKYTTPIGQTLEQYVPLPLEEMARAGAMIQQRGDLAEQQRDQLESGLASIETMFPAHASFKNNFVKDYNRESMELLNKYTNPSDPDFIRESRKLNLKFANDPRLQTIKQANELQRQNLQRSAQLKAEGKLFINPKFTGLDQNGNLSAAVPQVETVNTLQDWEEASKMAWQSIEDDGRGNKSNQGNLNRNRAQQLGAFANNTPEAQRLARAYQDTYGMSPEDATKAALTTVQSNLNKYGIRSDKSFEWERLQLAYREAAAKATEQVAPPLPFQLLSYSKPLTGNETTAANQNIKSKIKSALDDLDASGNLRTASRTIPDTEENRRIYGDKAKPVVRYEGEDRKYGLNPIKELSISGINTDQVKLLEAGRKMFNLGNKGSAKYVFDKMEKAMQDFDTSSEHLKSSTNVKLNEALADIARRQISSGNIYSVSNGQLNKVKFSDLTKDQIKELGDIKSDDIAGISPRNKGSMDGYTQFTDKSGNIYYTPIPKEYSQKFVGSKAVENYLKDFDPNNISPLPIKVGDKTINALINPNQAPIPYPYKGIMGQIVPYKYIQNGKMVAGALFQTSRGYAPLPLSEIENNEFDSLFGTIANDNKITGN